VVDLRRIDTRRPATLGPALLWLVLVAVLVGTAPPARAAGATYYVSPSGSDGAAGTLAAPWKTVAKGIRSLFPGDTLLVRNGTYVERITSVIYRPGTQSNPIRVAAYPGERPIVQGLLWIRDASYWTFDGINVTWDPANGTEEILAKIVDGVGWTFKNGELWGARSYASLIIATTKPGQPADWRLVGNCLHDTYGVHPPFQDHNLYIAAGLDSGPGVVERNLLFNATNGENIKVGAGSGGEVSHVTIRNNTLYNASQNALVAQASEHIVFERNLMGRSTGKWWYPNLRGFSVTGAGNIARQNMGFAASKFLLNTNSTTGIADGGGNLFPVDPVFASASCAGFQPTNAAAKMYGRWAPSGEPVAGDWDGDGTDTPGFVRGNVWYLNEGFDDTPERVFAYGSVADRKVVGDWDGDGTVTPGIVKGNTWFLNNGFDPNADMIFAYGSAGDVPVAGDWDGNGTDTPGVVKGNVWYLNNGFDPNAEVIFGYGSASDVRVTGDWDGNGTDNPGVVKGSVWYLNNAFGPTASTSFAYGSASHLPIVGDWDGDGDTTIGVVSVGDWLLRNTNTVGAPDISFSDEGWLP
jgi:hypothetical protein